MHVWPKLFCKEPVFSVIGKDGLYLYMETQGSLVSSLSCAGHSPQQGTTSQEVRSTICHAKEEGEILAHCDNVHFLPRIPSTVVTVAARQLRKSAHFSEILTQVISPSCYSFAKSHFPKTSGPFALCLQPGSLLCGSLSSPWLTSVSSYYRWHGFLSSCSLSSSSGKRLRFSF